MTSATKCSRTIVPKRLSREKIDGALLDDKAKSTADSQPQKNSGKAKAMPKSRAKSPPGRRVTRASSQKPSAHLNAILETPVSQAGTPSRYSRLNPICIPEKSVVDEQTVGAGPSARPRKQKIMSADYKVVDKQHSAAVEHETNRRPFAIKTVVSEQGEKIPPRRTAAQQRAAKKREAELEKDTTLEYAEKTIMEHEKILSCFPDPEELQRQEERFAKLEESIELQFKENERLRHENAMLSETITKVQLESIQLIEEVCDLKYHFGLSPLKYRRRDDAHGKPFGNWRRIPSSAEHIPAPIDTDKAQRNRRHTNKKLPVLTVSLDPSEPENRSSIEGVDAVPERSSLKRPREGRPSYSPSQPVGDSALSFQHSTTSTKREREDHGGDFVLDYYPPPKRIREMGGALQLLVLPKEEAENDAGHEFLNSVSSPVITKDADQAYIQACIDGGW